MAHHHAAQHAETRNLRLTDAANLLGVSIGMVRHYLRLGYFEAGRLPKHATSAGDRSHRRVSISQLLSFAKKRGFPLEPIQDYASSVGLRLKLPAILIISASCNAPCQSAFENEGFDATIARTLFHAGELIYSRTFQAMLIDTAGINDEVDLITKRMRDNQAHIVIGLLVYEGQQPRTDYPSWRMPVNYSALAREVKQKL